MKMMALGVEGKIGGTWVDSLISGENRELEKENSGVEEQRKEAEAFMIHMFLSDF